jgi:hypothetical protein
VAGEASGRAFAATWRNEAGETVGTTSAKTMCLWPRLPWRIRFHRDGFEGVVPCRECPGCLELERLRLERRLHEKYSKIPEGGDGPKIANPARTGTCSADRLPTLFAVRIYAPLDQHARIAHALHRRRGLELEPGMWRLGASSFALLSRSAPAPRDVLRKMGLRFRIEPLRLSRGRRAWRVLTAGLLVAREIYGEQRNRFYARGLPPAERQKWEVKKLGNYVAYNRSRAPRAWTGRKLVLVPPEVWQLSRTDRRSLRGQLLRQSDPEGVAKVMRLVSDAIRASASRFTVSAAAKPLLNRDAVVAWYQRNADRSKARTALPGSDSSNTPTSEVGGYTSCEHSQGELMPEQLAAARRKEDAERRRRKLIWESQEIIERMRKKSEGW